MTIDWRLVVDIGIPIFTLFLGGWVTRWFEKRPNLTTYFGHVSAFKATDDKGKKFDVFTHSVVVRNTGKKSATNVRFRHATLPDFVVSPAIDYTIVNLPEGGRDIVIPALVPNEEVTISYLYFPPLTWTGVNTGIRSDEGFAQAVPVLLQRQYPKTWGVSAFLLMVVGTVTTLYFVIRGIGHLVGR